MQKEHQATNIHKTSRNTCSIALKSILKNIAIIAQLRNAVTKSSFVSSEFIQITIEMEFFEEQQIKTSGISRLNGTRLTTAVNLYNQVIF